ncbi:ABC transporter permease [Sphingobium chungangianum]
MTGGPSGSTGGNRLWQLQSRLTHLLLVGLLVTFSSFMLLNLLPGDIVDAMVPAEGMSPEALAAARSAMEAQLGLNDPLPIRYWNWLGDLFHGDLGRSVATNQPVFEAIMQRLPVTLELVLLSQLVALSIAVPLGIWSAYRAHSTFDRIVTLASFALLSIPVFVLGIGLVLVFALKLGWFPAIGFVPLSNGLGANLMSLTLPALAIGATQAPFLLRIVRADMMATLQEEYIAMAKAKGLSPAAILFRHALRPSSLNLVTMVGLQLGATLSSSVVVETVFALPGIGGLLNSAITTRDAIMVQGIVTFLALAFVLINIVIDLVYGLLDPRVRL